MTESLVRYYLETFFDSPEQKELLRSEEVECEYKDEVSEEQWKELSDSYKSLLPFGHLDNYRFEVGKSGSFFIREIYKNYVDDDTFVLHSCYEHDTVRDCLSNVKNKLELVYSEIVSLDISTIISKFKKSGCKKFFLYMVGTAISTGEIMPQEFFIRLKEELTNRNIPHKFILDDVHGMFITTRDYSLFDCVIYTCHSWIVSFNMGFIFSRLPDKIGFRSPLNPTRYLELIKIIISKFDKVRQFKNILTEFFAEELSDQKTFGLYERTTPHIFAIATYDLVFPQQYYDKLYFYDIRLGETLSYRNFARIRCQEFIMKDPDYAIESLKELKKILYKCKYRREHSGQVVNYTNEQNITREHLPDPHADLKVKL